MPCQHIMVKVHCKISQNNLTINIKLLFLLIGEEVVMLIVVKHNVVDWTEQLGQQITKLIEPFKTKKINFVIIVLTAFTMSRSKSIFRPSPNSNCA